LFEPCLLRNVNLATCRPCSPDDGRWTIDDCTIVHRRSSIVRTGKQGLLTCTSATAVSPQLGRRSTAVGLCYALCRNNVCMRSLQCSTTMMVMIAPTTAPTATMTAPSAETSLHDNAPGRSRGRCAAGPPTCGCWNARRVRGFTLRP